MSTQTDRLMMHIGLIDQVTRPLQGITRQMQTTMDTGRQGMANMAAGGAGLIASGMAIQNALMPAIEMDRKMGEVASLGVTDEALKQLQATALDFSTEYGKSATDFVGASYDIQSAIAGLDGNELSAFTKSSAILAAATKADTGTITNYMGTLYGIFEKSAVSMGKAKWVENMTGMTATAVQMFKTDGTKMAQAFSSLGSSATAMGAGVAEQMAILGTLQATMGGGEAATKYTAFLGGAVKAQEKMGLSFSDSHGKLLPMVDILKKVDEQIGDLGEVAQYEVLKNAFGSDEAVKLIQNLLPKTDQLSDSINKLGDVEGMKIAEAMAGKMTDQWERMEASFFAVRAAVFGAILPSINVLVGAMADGMGILVDWIAQFPLLGDMLGWVGMGIMSLTGIVGALTLASGLATMSMAGLGIAFGILTSPITLVVAVIAGAVAALAYYWDYIAVFIGEFIGAFIQASGVADLFYPLIGAFQLIGDAVVWVIGQIMAFLPAVDATQTSLSGMANAGRLFGATLGTIFSAVIIPIKKVLSAIDWLFDKLNLLPGVSIDVGAEFSEIEKMSADMVVNTQVMPPPFEAPDFSKGWTPEIASAHQASNVVPMTPSAMVAHQATDTLPYLFEQQPETNVVPITPEILVANQATDTPPYVFQQQPETNVVPITPEMAIANQATETPPYLFGQQPETNMIPITPEMVVANQTAETPSTAFMQEVDKPVVTNMMAYKEPQNQTPLPPNMVSNATTVNKQQQGNNRTYGDITINASEPFTPDMLAQWDELNVG